MANNKKTVAPIIAIAVIFIFIGMIAPLINTSSVEKHLKVDKWYRDDIGTFIYDGDKLIDSLNDFYNATGVQLYVLIVNDEDRVSAAKAYNRNFPDDEHVLIYITECHPSYTSWDSESGSTYARYLLNGTYYDVEVYAGYDSLTSSKLRILERNLDDMELTSGTYNTNQSELIAAIDKTASEIGDSKGTEVILTIIGLIVSLMPTAFFILFIVLIVRFANKRNANKPKPTSAPYPTPTVTTISNNPNPETPKPVFKPLPTNNPAPVNPKPVVDKPVITKPVEPAPVVTETVSIEPTPVYTEPIMPSVTETEPVMSAMPEIKPIEPIDIKPITFDLEANNILDNIGDINYDIPNVVDTNFDDWGNL